VRIAVGGANVSASTAVKVQHMSRVDTSKFETQIDADVLAELEARDDSVDQLIAAAEKFVDGSEEQDLAVERYFIEKGCSDKLSGWLVREANTRRAPSEATSD